MLETSLLGGIKSAAKCVVQVPRLLTRAGVRVVELHEIFETVIMWLGLIAGGSPDQVGQKVPTSLLVHFQRTFIL